MNNIKSLNNAIPLNLDEFSETWKFSLNGKIAYFKPFDVKELIAEEVARVLDINTVHFNIGSYNNKATLYSYQFYDEKKEKYHHGFQLIKGHAADINEYNALSDEEEVTPKNLNNLTDIWGTLEYIFGSEYPEDIPKIMNDLVKMFCFDILLSVCDRNAYNWGIIESEEGIRLSPLFDNESMLQAEYYSLTDEDNLNENLNVLQNFLNTSDSYFTSIFYEMYEKLTPEVFVSIMNKMELERNLRIVKNKGKFSNRFFKYDLHKKYERHSSNIGKIIHKQQERKL